MSLRRLMAMAYKETLQIWRDRRSLAIALIMPLMQMALLGYGVSLDIRRVPLCIHDEEHSQTSRALIQSVYWGAGPVNAARAAWSRSAERRRVRRATSKPADQGTA